MQFVLEFNETTPMDDRPMRAREESYEYFFIRLTLRERQPTGDVGYFRIDECIDDELEGEEICCLLEDGRWHFDPAFGDQDTWPPQLADDLKGMVFDDHLRVGTDIVVIGRSPWDEPVHFADALTIREVIRDDQGIAYRCEARADGCAVPRGGTVLVEPTGARYPADSSRPALNVTIGVVEPPE